MRIVVTGADGAIGRGVAARLVSLSHDVVGVGEQRPESWPGAVDFVVARRATADVLKGADAVLHAGGSDLDDLADAMHEADVERLVVVAPVWPGAPIPAGVDAVVVRTGVVLGRHVDDAVLRLCAGPVVLDVDGSADRPLPVRARPRRRAGAGAGASRTRRLVRPHRRRRRAHDPARDRRGRRPTRRRRPLAAAQVRAAPDRRPAGPGTRWRPRVRRGADGRGLRPGVPRADRARACRARHSVATAAGAADPARSTRRPPTASSPCPPEWVPPTANSTRRSIPAFRRSSRRICPRRWRVRSRRRRHRSRCSARARPGW